MLCEVQVFGRYGRKPPTHIEPGTGEETGTHETGTTGESDRLQDMEKLARW
ncbi:hypothetical protein BOX15_Mlig000828g1 [Macrostomum lignano]|uniref:Uncharacterized protein n=1 Tax=Macrostomum lignano TaxID=282301 RepID=A0A267F5E1_9PLAT|nr:hypothetical protein BOX15_Mlig000828g1 [Macrostomum lignano]